MLIDVFSRIPAAERERLAETAAPLASYSVYSANIIASLNTIPEAERAEMVNLMLREGRGLLTRDRDNIGMVIQDLGRVALGERAALAEMATRIARSDLDGKKIREVIKLLGELPSGERQAFTELVTKFRDDDTFLREEIIINLGFVPAVERLELAALATRLVADDGRNAPGVIFALSSVHKDERQALVQRAIGTVRQALTWWHEGMAMDDRQRSQFSRAVKAVLETPQASVSDRAKEG